MANEGAGKEDRVQFTGDAAADQLARLKQFDTPEAKAARDALAGRPRPAPQPAPTMPTPTKKLTYTDI